MMQQRRRQDYPGEFIITRTTFRDGRKIQEREWIDNPIVNQHISGRAAVIATADDRERFDHARLQYHRAGVRIDGVGHAAMMSYQDPGSTT